MREIGGMTVGELESRMTAREMNEWYTLFKIERKEEEERDLERKSREGLDKMRRVGFGGRN